MSSEVTLTVVSAGQTVDEQDRLSRAAPPVDDVVSVDSDALRSEVIDASPSGATRSAPLGVVGQDSCRAPPAPSPSRLANAVCAGAAADCREFPVRFNY